MCSAALFRCVRTLEKAVRARVACQLVPDSRSATPVQTTVAAHNPQASIIPQCPYQPLRCVTRPGHFPLRSSSSQNSERCELLDLVSCSLFPFVGKFLQTTFRKCTSTKIFSPFFPSECSLNKYGAVIGNSLTAWTTGTPLKFTGKELDTESGLDNFGARYNSSTMGRFMTPDWSAAPMGVPYANFGNPQSLNLYSYV
ncbi:MAG: hypothetical protein M3P45_07470, partial [Acidobacteriota bacterium]|nr:hypothetical protein [Acidobacteriota bacterium]